ncbi:hypothetical protein AVEN_205544-2-1, partial [Araneus ventricosus]
FNGTMYRIFLEEVFPELLDNVPVAVRDVTWFQHDWIPDPFCSIMLNYFNATFGPRWIERGGPFSW